MGKTMKARYVLVILAALSCGDIWARDKSDVVWLSNGDRITGEIKQLERGKLRVSTDSMGTIYIEWKDVERIDSKFEFQVEGTRGERVTGTIAVVPDQREITVSNKKEAVQFSHERVVRIAQIEDRFLDRLKGSVSLGYSFTKASDVAQGNLAFQLNHRTEIRSLVAEGNTIVTTDQANETTQRSNLRFGMNRFLPNRWFTSFVLQFEKNDELGLRLRSGAGAGIGRYLLQTNTSEFALVGGLLATRELLAYDVASEENLEGALGAEYSRYIFDDPTVDMDIRFSIFPGLTDAGRNRTQLDANIRWEVYKDLFWELNYYNTYDSDPPSGSASNSDYGVVTSLGYSF
jgi:hypothetical protein